MQVPLREANLVAQGQQAQVQLVCLQQQKPLDCEVHERRPNREKASEARRMETVGLDNDHLF
jgi:hypothetical protein